MTLVQHSKKTKSTTAPSLPKAPHLLTPEEVAKALSTDSEGLTDEQAASKLPVYGRNELEDGGGPSAIRIFIKQVVNAMMLVRSVSLTLNTRLIKLSFRSLFLL